MVKRKPTCNVKKIINLLKKTTSNSKIYKKYTFINSASIKVTPLIKELAWRLESMRSFFLQNSPLLTKETPESSMSIKSYSSSKIKKKIDYNFISFNDSVKKYCKFFKRDLI